MIKDINFSQSFYKLIILCFYIAVTITSCSTKKQIHYLQNIDEYNNKPFNNKVFTIQPNDILHIKIVTPNYSSPVEAVEINEEGGLFNLQVLQLQGYTVSPDFMITHKILGKINVKDKTTYDLEDEITEGLLKLNQLKNPVVTVKLLNAKYTITGEVRSPGTFNMLDRLTILQALGSAGDLTLSGKRENITIVRQENGKQIVGYLDLTSASITKSPFFYIKQNDWIYVHPNGPKTKSAGYIGSLGSAISIISVALSTYLILRANF